MICSILYFVMDDEFSTTPTTHLGESKAELFRSYYARRGESGWNDSWDYYLQVLSHLLPGLEKRVAAAETCPF